MKELLVVFAHLLSAFATVLKPGGAKSLVAENLLLRQQLLILRRSRRRAPNLRAKVAADACKGVLENDQVRLLEVRAKPGTKIPMHAHPADVAYAITDGANTQ
jgi:hypothetical protein